MTARWEWPTASAALYFGPPAGTEGDAVREHGRTAVFLDRDGVLIEGVADPESGWLESALRIEEVRLLPGVAEALQALARAGCALICVSNQPAAAKGKVTLERIRAIHERTIELLAERGAGLDASYLCPHHPDGVLPELAGACTCRKPAPGMLADAGRRFALEMGGSWMVGDTDADVAAGRAAGCRTALLAYGGTAHKRSGAATPDLSAPDLPGAVVQLLDHRRG